MMFRRHWMSTLCAFALALAASAGPARAQSAAPWEEGVSPEEQAAATALFREGNALLKDSLFLRAMEKYREALKHWDHPGIHFNLALALIPQDKPLEAHDSLKKAMQYGPDAIGQVKFERAKVELERILKDLAWLEITCEHEGARVTLDGKQVFVAPGKWEGYVVEGKHAVVATKEGFINANEAPDLDGGARASVKLELFTAEDLTEYRRRWAPWKPWTVFASGVAVAALGGTLHLFSVQNFDEYDRQIQECTDMLGGMQCNPAVDAPGSLDVLGRARLQQGFAYVMYGVGGAAIVGGLVLVYANRLKPHRLDVEERNPADVAVVPLIGRDLVGVSAGFRF